MKITLHATTKGFTVNNNHFEAPYDKFFGNVVESMGAEMSFSCIRWISNGLHNSTSMDISFYLAAVAIHGHTIVVSKQIYTIPI